MRITVFTMTIALTLMARQAIESEKPSEVPTPGISTAARHLLDSLNISEHTGKRLNTVVNELLPRRDLRLIPLREEGYETAPSHVERLVYAAQLVFLGAEDPKYWSYLYGQAKAAVGSGLPARGEMAGLPEEHPDLTAWREQRGLTGREAEELLSHQIMTMIALGAAVEPRAFDLLVECLSGPNHFLYSPCMQGLARLQDRRAIEPMISALGRLSPQAAATSAWFLLYFDDPRAEEAAERFIADEKLLLAYRKKVAKGVQGLYGY